MLNYLLLSKLQFIFTICFHIIFPSLSIGLALFLVIFEFLWLCTKKKKYYKIIRFFSKLFAISFGMGVVSGIMMEFQLGTNWSGFSEKVGPVLGALFTYEILTAFFIEAGALGIMIFGWNKVSKLTHFCSTLLVFIGVSTSAFWILAANSWMQVPHGVSYINNEFIVHNWSNVVISPNSIQRYIHMILASYISSFLLILSISLYHMKKNKSVIGTNSVIKFSLISIFILSILQIFSGDLVGLNINKYQPLKIAALEGIWQSQKRAPLILTALINSSKEKITKTIEIPLLSSLLNTHNTNGILLGLKEVSSSYRPHMLIVFYCFRVMVILGFLICIIAAIGIILFFWLNRFFSIIMLSKYFYNIIFSLGFLSIIMGWFTAEFGRQPWVVYKMLKTENTVSYITKWKLIISFLSIIFIYSLIFGKFYTKYIKKIIKKGY